jgi:hypothetical protein
MSSAVLSSTSSMPRRSSSSTPSSRQRGPPHAWLGLGSGLGLGLGLAGSAALRTPAHSEAQTCEWQNTTCLHEDLPASLGFEPSGAYARELFPRRGRHRAHGPAHHAQTAQISHHRARLHMIRVRTRARVRVGVGASSATTARAWLGLRVRVRVWVRISTARASASSKAARLLPDGSAAGPRRSGAGPRDDDDDDDERAAAAADAGRRRRAPATLSPRAASAPAPWPRSGLPWRRHRASARASALAAALAAAPVASLSPSSTLTTRLPPPAC